MHQQVRTSTKTREAPGAANAEPGSITDILTKLAERGVNLRSAGGCDFDKGGEFVFSVHHDDKDPDGPIAEAVSILERNGYRPYVIEPYECNVQDQPGGLLGCIKELEGRGDEVAEIHIGTGTPVPVQIVTRSQIDEGQRTLEQGRSAS